MSKEPDRDTGRRALRVLGRTVLMALWLLSGLSGVVVGLVGFLGLVDPAGSQMANDADPFGEPPSALWAIFLMCTGALLIAWPILLVARSRGQSDVDRAQ